MMPAKKILILQIRVIVCCGMIIYYVRKTNKTNKTHVIVRGKLTIEYKKK